MDRRKVGLCLVVGMLGGLGGCQHGGTSGKVVQEPAGAPLVSAAPVVVDRSVVKEAENLPPKTPLAKTCVAYADWATSEARTPDLPVQVKQAYQEKARLGYQQAIAVDPKYVPAYRGLGRLYLDMQDPAHALETYRRAVTIAPKHGELWFELGMIHNRQQEWAKAIDALDRAACCDPENRKYVNTLGYTLARAGRYDEAFRCFCRVTTEARAHYKLARMQEHLGQKDRAREQLRLAMRKDPRLEEARALLQWLESPQPEVRPVGHSEPGSGGNVPAPRR